MEIGVRKVAKVATEKGLVSLQGSPAAVACHLDFVRRNARRDPMLNNALREEVARLAKSVNDGDIDPAEYIDADVQQLAKAIKLAVSWLGTAALEAVERATKANRGETA
jgi:hypothetical protein